MPLFAFKVIAYIDNNILASPEELLWSHLPDFFNYVQDARWYDLFLASAVAALQTVPPNSKQLDIGTGPGKFIELLQTQFGFDCIGTEIDAVMLAQAKKRLP